MNMDRKKIRFAVFLFCVSAASAFSQNAVSLDTGLGNGVRYFEGRLPRGTKLVVLGLSSAAPALSEYATEELTVYFVNSAAFIGSVFTRSDLDLLDQEMMFQLSGEVSDESAQSIGKKVGAQTIVSGSITPAGDVFRLRIRAIAVESAAIQGIFTANIVRDRFLTGLFNTGSGTAAPGAAPPRSPSVPASGSGGTGGRVRLPDYLLNN